MGAPPPAPQSAPIHAAKQYETFGYALAMHVLQSDLYHNLDDKERAECDEMIRAGQYAPPAGTGTGQLGVTGEPNIFMLAPPDPVPAQTDEKGRAMTYWGGLAAPAQTNTVPQVPLPARIGLDESTSGYSSRDQQKVDESVDSPAGTAPYEPEGGGMSAQVALLEAQLNDMKTSFRLAQSAVANHARNALVALDEGDEDTVKEILNALAGKDE